MTTSWKYLYIYLNNNKVIFLDLSESECKVEENGIRLIKTTEERFYPFTSIQYYKFTINLDPKDTPK